MDTFDDPTLSMLKAGASLIVVLCLMLGLAAAFKKFSGTATNSLNSLKKRLSVKEVRAIDHKHKLVLIQRDNMEHLLLLSGNSAPIVIENNIVPIATDDIKNETLQKDKG